MSSAPYKEGVTEVLILVKRYEELATKAEELRPIVEEYKKKSAELSDALEQMSKVSQHVHDMLDAMDLQSQGNMGFGGRMGWFIAEMRRQILAEVKAEVAKEQQVPPPPKLVPCSKWAGSFGACTNCNVPAFDHPGAPMPSQRNCTFKRFVCDRLFCTMDKGKDITHSERCRCEFCYLPLRDHEAEAPAAKCNGRECYEHTGGTHHSMDCILSK